MSRFTGQAETTATDTVAPRLELFCLPPAGGSAAVFRRWQEGLAPYLGIRAIDRPRSPRAGARLSLTDTAESLVSVVVSGGAYALVGHSLGGLLAYETAARICATPGLPWPRFVLVMGCRPPHRSSADFFAPMLDLTDGALLDALAEVGAVNPALRTSPLRNLFLPALRADLALVASYRPDPPPSPIPVDLLAWHAVDDELARPALGTEWRRYTTANFELTTFDGGHFFPYERMDDVTSALLAHPLTA